jgi:hypothetical protein
MNSCDAQSLGGPPNIEPNNVAFADQIDSRHRAADARARDRHEWKLKRDLLAAMRSHYAAAARTVELENHPLVEISRKALTVEIVFVCHHLGSYGIDMQVCNSPSALSIYPIALALCP